VRLARAPASLMLVPARSEVLDRTAVAIARQRATFSSAAVSSSTHHVPSSSPPNTSSSGSNAMGGIERTGRLAVKHAASDDVDDLFAMLDRRTKRQRRAKVRSTDTSSATSQPLPASSEEPRTAAPERVGSEEGPQRSAAAKSGEAAQRGCVVASCSRWFITCGYNQA